MDFLKYLKQKVSEVKDETKILLIDGIDERTIAAAYELKKYPNIKVTVLTENNEQCPSDLTSLNIHANPEQYKQFCEEQFTKRKGKESLVDIQAQFKTRPYYAMKLVENGLYDGAVGGLIYSTADIIRPALKVIGAKPGIKTVSSVVVMFKNDLTYFCTDVSLNIDPTSEQLVEIAKNACDFAQQLDYNPLPAFLSFSTQGSASHALVDKVRKAAELFNATNPKNQALGEVQLDAAIDLRVRAKKVKNPSYSEPANVLIYPDLNAGNIGTKIFNLAGNFSYLGPVITGLRLPVNDLSRGGTPEEVVYTVLTTVLQAKGLKHG